MTSHTKTPRTLQLHTRTSQLLRLRPLPTMHPLGTPSCPRGQFEARQHTFLLMTLLWTVPQMLSPCSLPYTRLADQSHPALHNPWLMSLLNRVFAWLWDFPKASAPGPSGWRAQHTLKLVTGPASTVCAEARQALTTFVGLALSGRLDPYFANSLA